MINIAIDGFTGSGKSTLVRALAKRLGENFKVLDTGAIFRGLGFEFDKEGFEPMNEENVDKFLKNVQVKVTFVGDVQHVFVNGEDVTDFLRSEKVSQLASKISVFPKVRAKYLEIAQKFAKEHDCLMEGRDIGTVVMPNADVKIFLTADAKVRAQRRYAELVEKGVKTTLKKVLKDLNERDLRDSTREVAPLVPTDESFIVDNTDMNFDETVDFCYNLIKSQLAEKKQTIKIAIDGYAGSGKSTITRELARRLGFKVFDTGAIYRGIACAFRYMNMDDNKIDENYICKFAKQISVKVAFLDGLEHVFVNGI